MQTIAFFSYARHDDMSSSGLLSKIRMKLETEIQAYSGEAELEVFQDTDDIEPGDEWEERLRDAIDGSAFFLPVITPFYFSRPACRRELETWLANYKSAEERKRIIPIKFLPLPKIDTSGSADPLRKTIEGIQFEDFTDFRHNTSLRGRISVRISELAELIISRRAS
ncbi:toll/interleukin-1 receptor domain-containing protein [Oricola sp.]|uniref:toll/interleukin-1 receptor domain-containing protein n=1 Tax=Oricola sp. TaxID=1979950 RepID=UPI003BAA731E